LAGSAYDDEEEDDEAEWAGDDTTWTEEEEANDEIEGKDESSAYLEFLNEEVGHNCILPFPILT
jgi:importin-7